MSARLRHIMVLSLAALSLLIAPSAPAQNIIYVNQAATGANDGNSWNDAYVFLQDALQAAQSGDEVWVAQGVYRPDQGAGVVPGDRDESFVILSGISLFGGFDGSETTLDLRDWGVHETILSGDLLGNDDTLLTSDNPLREDNAYHVVRAADITELIVLDGFTFSDGMAWGDHLNQSGAAIKIVSHPQPQPSAFPLMVVDNSRFTKNVSVEGTIYSSIAPSETIDPVLVIRQSVFENNWANRHAAAKIENGATLFANVQIVNNAAVQYSAIAGNAANLYIDSSVIANNTTETGAAVHFSGGPGALYIWNSIFTGNRSTRWGAGAVYSSLDLISINNIFSGNSTQTEGGALDLCCARSWIVNNVFAFNSAARGGAISSVVSNINISNSIFWGNTAPNSPEFLSRSVDTVRISHSLIQNPLPLNIDDRGGIISGDPLFQDADGIDNIPGTIDDDFQLLYWSPAVDAGTNDLLFADFWDLDNDGDFDEFWPTDFYGDPRIIGIRPSSFPVVDLGPFEFKGPPPTPIEEDESPGVNGPSIIGVYPNPFASNTSITITVDHPSEITIEIYNILGKRVRVLEQGYRAAGEHSVHLDAADLSSGVYFVRLSAGSNSQTRKMVVMK